MKSDNAEKPVECSDKFAKKRKMKVARHPKSLFDKKAYGGGLPKDEKRIPRSYRANTEETQKIKRRAEIFAGGDVSLWLRYAAMNHIPAKPLVVVSSL